MPGAVPVWPLQNEEEQEADLRQLFPFFPSAA